ncbi:hypothetical protein F5146DRAFT_316084 [Armillaria mellea]|nr:hypothetical protein F5146DRAFT_316084 [Armillaria mellea]
MPGTFGKHTSIYSPIQLLIGWGGYPDPAMELRMERMLRFEQFIPHFFHEDHWLARIRVYPEHAFHTIELAASVYSNPFFPQNSPRPWGSVTAWTFFRHALINHAQFPVIIWFNLVQNVINEDEFSPIDPTSQDSFTITLCLSVCWALVSKEPSTSLLSSPAVDFRSAVERFQPGVIDKFLLLRFSVYDHHQDHPSISIRLRVLLSLTEFACSRIFTTEIDGAQDAFQATVGSLKAYLSSSILSTEENIAVFNTILAIIENGKWALIEWARTDLLDIYVHMLGISIINPIPVERFPEAAQSLPGLNELVSVLGIGPVDQYSHFNSVDLVCNIIGYGLREDVRAAYDVFLDMHCLEVFSRIPFHPRLVGVVKGYVNGLHRMARSTPVILAQHLDYLHQPENLAVACIILAVNDEGNADTESVKMDVMRLVQLRPWDPAWPICRDRLQDVLESDQFFSSQRTLDHYAAVMLPFNGE